MEQTKHSLDLRTLLLLIVEHEDLPWDKVMELIADEVSVPTDQLKAAIAKHSEREANLAAGKLASVQLVTKTQPELDEQKKRPYSRWERERLDELVVRWNSGQKPSVIAKEMQISTQTVYQKISQLRKSRGDVKIRYSRNPAFMPQTKQGERNKAS